MKSMFLTMFQKGVPLLCALALTACGGGGKKTTTVEIPAQPAYAKTDLVVGTGETVVAGDLATVNYTGYLYDSTKPNSRGTQFETGSRSFAAGTGANLPGTTYALLGWDQGVPGMKVGGKANLVLPYNLAYGVYEHTGPLGVKVPVYSPVVFEVEVVSVKKASPSASVKIIKEVVGTGADVEYSKVASVNYTGWLYDESKPEFKGTQFDASAAGTPLSYVIANPSSVKDGFVRATLGMKVGGKRTVSIPPELMYGNTAVTETVNGATVTKIPANSTLVFDIELVSVK
jgi:peptidylprolyl isomerase